MSKPCTPLRASASPRENSEIPALVPKLRFPEFRGAEGWDIGKIDDLVDTVTPPKKLPTSNYAATGAFPIIDQSQNDICGWTDDNDALIQEDLPLIIFGDHTCILKLIDRPFAQGADGIKILKSRPEIGTSFLYQFLSYRPVATEEYKRHYSILKEKLVAFPDFKTGEQQKIAECLSSVDELMAAQARKVDALKTHKKGLMQQLFPREGETQPRLRFPEFQNAGEWTQDALGNVCTVLNNRRRPITSSDRKPGPYRYYGASGVVDYVDDFIFDERVVLVGEDGAKWGAFERTAFLVEGKFWVNNHAHVLKPHGVNDALLENYLTMADLAPFVTGAAPPKLTLGKLKEIPVPSPPDEEEGEAIATCLSSLDALITAETQKHEALKTHKKGLMQQLFPSPEEVES